MKSNIKKLNAMNIIESRKRLDSAISKYWSWIKNENTLRINAVKFRFHNLPEIHNKILQCIEKRIVMKGLLNQLNNGIPDSEGIIKFDLDTFYKSHYYTIFRLQESQEQLTKLNEIRKKCVAPKTKAQKGKKGTGYNEVFSYEKITAMINHLEHDINTYKSLIEEYNEKTTIETSYEGTDSLFVA